MTSSPDLLAVSARLLTIYDEDRPRVVDGLHDALGNHGTTHDDIEPFLEGLVDALHAGHAGLQKRKEGEEIDRPQESAIKRLPHVIASCQALLRLAGLKDLL